MKSPEICHAIVGDRLISPGIWHHIIGDRLMSPIICHAIVGDHLKSPGEMPRHRQAPFEVPRNFSRHRWGPFQIAPNLSRHHWGSLPEPLAQLPRWRHRNGAVGAVNVDANRTRRLVSSRHSKFREFLGRAAARCLLASSRRSVFIRFRSGWVLLRYSADISYIRRDQPPGL